MAYASRRSSNYTGGILSLLMIIFWVAAIGGWIANIAKIVWSASEPLTALFIIRIAGVVVAPVGAVLGFF